MQNQGMVSKLFKEIGQGDSLKVPLLKQNCLVEYIKDTFSDATSNLKDYKFFCQYQPSSETYSVVIYGVDTPLSFCCKQLICFQFTKTMGGVRVLCLDPLCIINPLEEIQIKVQLLETIFEIPNESQENNYSTFMKDSSDNIKEDYQIVLNERSIF
mmetsp:Transcript_53/g.54  ORF Transcript_53/g.54 Transcript_53/m.54 type:complete len:156 (-) Transcript_53:32-499(-)